MGQQHGKYADSAVYRAVANSATSVKPLSLEEAVYTVALGREIARRREIAGVGQAELGRLVNIGPNYMWRVEHGQRRLRRSMIAKIAVWLIPLDDWADARGPSDDQHSALVDELVRIAGPALAPERVRFLDR